MGECLRLGPNELLTRSRPVIFVVALALTLPRPAAAQRDLTQEQPAPWYAAHLGLSTLALLVSAGAMGGAGAFSLGRWDRAPSFERGTEQRWSATAAVTSDWLLGANLLLSPTTLLLGASNGRAGGNATLIDAEAVSLSLLANTLTKVSVLRARPVQAGRRPAGQDGTLGPAFAQRSFYSGHAALTATSAASGGVLLDAVSSSVELRTGFWATQLALAALTAHLRVRAGLHYPSDVLVGGVVGAAIGVAVPLAHGVKIEIAPEEVVGMGAGLLLGTAGGFLFPSELGARVLRHPLVVRPLQAGGTVFEVTGTFP